MNKMQKTFCTLQTVLTFCTLHTVLTFLVYKLNVRASLVQSNYAAQW